MRIVAAVAIALATACLILGAVHRLDTVPIVVILTVGLAWMMNILLRGPASFDGFFFVLMTLMCSFAAGFGVGILSAAAALSFSLCGWDLCMTAPRIAAYPRRQRRRFVSGYVARCMSWALLGALLVLFARGVEGVSESIYVSLALVILAFVVILFLLKSVRRAFSGEAQGDQDEGGWRHTTPSADES